MDIKPEVKPELEEEVVVGEPVYEEDLHSNRSNDQVNQKPPRRLEPIVYGQPAPLPTQYGINPYVMTHTVNSYPTSKTGQPANPYGKY